MEAQALVDMGATRLYLQRRVIAALGLRSMSGITSRTMELEIQGRRGLFDVVELPDTLPNIIGQIPLEHLDWVVDLRGRKLIPNPEHKHGELADEYTNVGSVGTAFLRKSAASQNMSLLRSFALVLLWSL